MLEGDYLLRTMISKEAFLNYSLCVIYKDRRCSLLARKLCLVLKLLFSLQFFLIIFLLEKPAPLSLHIL